MTTKENEIRSATGRIAKMSLESTTEDEIIREFRIFYSQRHTPRFGNYIQHPRNNARYAIWVLRYIRYHRNDRETPKE